MAQNGLSDVRPNAWLLDFGQTLRAAVGTRTLLQIVDSPRLQSVPCTPPHCHSVINWQGRLLPALDLGVLFGKEPLPAHLLAIAAWQRDPDKPPQFGALLLAAPPVAIIVGNEQACPLPEQPAAWSRLALSCFGHQGDAIPVLHVARAFARLAEAR